MKHNMAQAVVRLQRRIRNASSLSDESRADEALNLLLNKPDRGKPPHHLERNMLSEATKKLARRAELATDARLAALMSVSGDGSYDTLAFELRDFLARDLGASDSALLMALLEGEGTDEIALALGVPVARIQERLSRARARAAPRWFH